MTNMIISILLSALAFFIGSKILPGVTIKNALTAILVAVVVAILNVTIGVFLKVVTLGILALGIFTWLLNAILIQIADWFIEDFKVNNFWWALGLAAIVSIIQSMLGTIF